jgi:hypothetical protein
MITICRQFADTLSMITDRFKVWHQEERERHSNKGGLTLLMNGVWSLKPSQDT